MQNLRQPLKFNKGLGRFEEEAPFSVPKAYIHTTRGRKRHKKKTIKMEEIRKISTSNLLILGILSV